MKEKNNKKKKGNKNNSKNQTAKKGNEKKEVKEKVEVKEQNAIKEIKVEKIETKKEKRVVENKKENKNASPLVTSNEIKNLLIIVLVVTAIFLIFYGITTIVTKNKDNNNELTGEVTIQYDEILLGTLFEQPNSEYYVLITKEDDTYASTYSNLIAMYTTGENAIRFYTANLDNSFNKSYEAEQSNVTSNLKELKLSGSTLLKIQNKNIVVAYEGKTQIVAHLNSLLK